MPANWSDLSSRVASGVLMALAALATAWLGGWLFFLFWLAAALAIFAEWQAMVVGSWRPTSAVIIGAVALVAAGTAAFMGQTLASLASIVIGAVLVAFLTREPGRAVFTGPAVPYAAAAVVPPVLLRADPALGAIAIFFLFAVVWGTDIMAYFCGRTFGGPKLWPAVSPKKTWSGFVGGALCGAAVGAMTLLVAGVQHVPLLFVVAAVLAVVSQGGDLFESALKRHFGVKDASRLIPGHGGVMDRLDGFLAASLLALLIGLSRNPGSPAAGLLQW